LHNTAIGCAHFFFSPADLLQRSICHKVNVLTFLLKFVQILIFFVQIFSKRRDVFSKIRRRFSISSRYFTTTSLPVDNFLKYFHSTIPSNCWEICNFTSSIYI